MTVDVGRIGIWTFSGLWGERESLSSEGAAAIAEAEELGYGAVWLGRADGSLRLVEGLLAAGRRIAVGTSIVNIWMNGPEVVAPAYDRVSRLHPNRLLLGLGVGHAAAAEAMGERYVRPVEKLIQYLDELDEADPGVPADGRALAALGPRMLALSAKRSVGALPYLTTPDHTRRARDILGPDPLLAVEQKVIVENDRTSARALGRAGVARYFRLPNYASNLKRLGFSDDDLADEGSDRLIDAVVAWGDVAAIARRVREHIDAGADHVAVQVLTDGVVAGAELPVSQWRALAPALLG